MCQASPRARWPQPQSGEQQSSRINYDSDDLRVAGFDRRESVPQRVRALVFVFGLGCSDSRKPHDACAWSFLGRALGQLMADGHGACPLGFARGNEGA